MFITAGFVSSERGYVTTVAHGLPACRGKEGNIEVKFWNDPHVYKATIARYNKLVDVAILHIDKMPKIAPLQIATEAPGQGTHVIALGHPQMLFWSASDGIVSADRWSGRPLMHVIQVSCPINFGNSGGPVINDKGQVVGITSFMINNPSLGFIIAGDFVKLVANGL
jgi:S1-C subfamily serine protease